MFYVSALLGRGIADLKLAIKKRLIDLNCIGSDVVLTTRRQVDSISSCEQSIRRAISQLQNEHPELEIVSFETRDAIRSLGRLVGDATVDEVLDKIFSDFCVGK